MLEAQEDIKELQFIWIKSRRRCSRNETIKRDVDRVSATGKDKMTLTLFLGDDGAEDTFKWDMTL